MRSSRRRRSRICLSLPYSRPGSPTRRLLMASGHPIQPRPRDRGPFGDHTGVAYARRRVAGELGAFPGTSRMRRTCCAWADHRARPTAQGFYENSPYPGATRRRSFPKIGDRAARRGGQRSRSPGSGYRNAQASYAPTAPSAGDDCDHCIDHTSPSHSSSRWRRLLQDHNPAVPRLAPLGTANEIAEIEATPCSWLLSQAPASITHVKAKLTTTSFARSMRRSEAVRPPSCSPWHCE